MEGSQATKTDEAEGCLPEILSLQLGTEPTLSRSCHVTAGTAHARVIGKAQSDIELALLFVAHAQS